MSRFGLKKMRRKIKQTVRTACKFRYIVTYEYVEVKTEEEWKPTELNILWFRGHRTKSSTKPSWSIHIPNQLSKTSTCTAKWTPPYSVDLIVTLYKDVTGTSFKKKDYMFVMEDICGSKRKKLAIFPCNLAKYVSMVGETSDLEMEFKSLSKKVISAKCGLKIRCEFIKQGSSIDDDMQSNFSHMSEGEEFSRLSELAEVSDEDDFSEADRYDDIPEVDEPGEQDDDFESWQQNIVRRNTEFNEEPQTTVAPVKTKSKPWSKFVAEMNSFEWKQIPLLRNPMSSSDKKKIADRLKEKHTMGISKDQQPASKPSSDTEYDLPDHHDKRLISAESFDEDDYEDDVLVDDDDDRSNSSGSLSSNKSKNGLKANLKETLKHVTSKTAKLRSPGSTLEEMKKLESKLQEQNAAIWNLEKDNKQLIVENNKLQEDVYDLQKQRDELQTEISELQILVEDLKTRLSQSEAEHKQLREEEKELLARMNLRGWLCKRGIKGITGRIWRRRWFSTDKSGKLYYYKQNNSSTPQGFIDLDHIISVQDQSERLQDKNKASFNVIVGKRKYELMAHDPEEKQKWINALDYLRHWRSHTARYLTINKELNEEKPVDDEDALNPFL